jgi:hypothetical protein
MNYIMMLSHGGTVVEVSLLDVQLEQCTLGRYFFYPVL